MVDPGFPIWEGGTEPVGGHGCVSVQTYAKMKELAQIVQGHVPMMPPGSANDHSNSFWDQSTTIW